MKQKLSILFMTIILAITPFVGNKHVDASENENLIVNASFEELENNIPTNWVANESWESGAVIPHAEAARTGDVGLKMDPEAGKNYWIRQTIPVQGGATYELAAWLREIDHTSGMGSRLKVEFYQDTTDGAGFVGERTILTPTTSSEEWTEITDEIEIPEEANTIQVYLRWYGSGIVHYDDISFKMTKPAPAVKVTTDQYFYYTNIEQGTIYGKILPVDHNYADKTVDVKIYPSDGGEPILHEEGLEAVEDFEYDFDPQPMITQEPYDVELTLKSNENEVLYKNKETIYRWERPTSIQEDGTLIVDGEPFFPIIGYHVPVGDYGEVKEAVNTVQGGPVGENGLDGLERHLDRAEEHGLKVLVNLYGHNMRVAENFELTKRKVERFKDHPAVLAWMVMDEPHTNGITYDELKEAYRIIRTIDPVHPTYIVENSTRQYTETGKVTDVLVTDPYPLPQRAITEVGKENIQAIEAVSNNKPVWTILQAYRKTAQDNFIPSINELRHMTYQSILEGGQAMGYYAFTDPGWNLMESDLYAGILSFTETEIPHIADFVPNGQMIDMYKDDNVQWGIWENDDVFYAAVLNLTEEDQIATVSLPGNGYDVEVIAPERSQYNTFDNELTLELSGLEATLVKLSEPTSSADIKVLVENLEDEGAFKNNAAHDLKLHLTAVDRFENQGANNKVIKHMKGFTQLLDHQRKNELISEETYNLLESEADALTKRMIESLLQVDIEVETDKVIAGGLLQVKIQLTNKSEKEMSDVTLNLGWPEEFELDVDELTYQQIESGETIEKVFEVTVPENADGTYHVTTNVQFTQSGVNMNYMKEKLINITPLIEAKLDSETIYAKKSGHYPFTLTLTNNASEQASLILDGEFPEGMALDIEAPIEIDSGQTVEVEGNLLLSNALPDGKHKATIQLVTNEDVLKSLSLTVDLDRNLVVNPGFEEGVNVPSSWDFRAGDWVQDEVNSGQYAASLIPDSENTFNVINSTGIKVEPGKTYKLSGWMKSDATGDGDVGIGLRKIDGNGNTINPYEWTYADPNSDWTYYELEFHPTSRTERVSIYLRLDQQADGQAWFDDIRFEEVVEELDSNLVINPSFEEGVNVPNGWDFRAGDWVQDEVNSGQYAASLVPDSDNTFNVINSTGINVEADKTYKLSGWIKSDASGDEDVGIGLRKIEGNGNTINPYEWTYANPNSDWTYYELEFHPTSRTERVSIYLRLDQQADGQAWFDDIRFEEIVED